MIDIMTALQWEKANIKMNAQIYRGVFHALFEVTHGLMHLFSHKKSILVIEGQTYHFEELLAPFYRLGFQVIKVQEDQLEEAKRFLNEKPMEILFLLQCQDHPITDQKFLFQELDELANQKKVFSICLSHNMHSIKLEPANFSVLINRLDAQYAVARLGARVKAKPLVAHRMLWSKSELLQVQTVVEKLRSQDVLSNQELIENIEAHYNKLNAQYASTIIQNKSRYFDRVILFLENLNADLIQHQLAQIGITSYTMSSCEHGYLPDQQWWKHTYSDDQIRGMVIIPAHQFMGLHEATTRIDQAILKATQMEKELYK